MQMRIGYKGGLLACRIARVCEREKEIDRQSVRELVFIVCEPLHHLQAGRVAPCRWLLMRARCSLCLLCVPAGASRLTCYSLTPVGFVDCVCQYLRLNHGKHCFLYVCYAPSCISIFSLVQKVNYFWLVLQCKYIYFDKDLDLRY